MSKTGSFVSVASDQEGADVRIVTERDPFPVHILDTHFAPVNEYFHLHAGTSTTLAVEVASGDTSIEVVSPTGFVVGSEIQIENGVIEGTFPIITVVAGSVLTLDRPLDNGFDVGDTVELITTDMSVSGSLGSPVAYRLIPNKDQIWHITRVLIGMVHPTASADDFFGDIATLANGCVLRAYNGAADQYGTFTVWKSNGDMKMDMYDVAYTDKAGGGEHGTNGRGSIKIGTGAVPRLDGSKGDYLELLVQDNISALTLFRLKGQGHFESI